MAMALVDHHRPRRAAHHPVLRDGVRRALGSCLPKAGIEENAGGSAVIRLPALLVPAAQLARVLEGLLAELWRYNAPRSRETHVQLRLAFHVRWPVRDRPVSGSDATGFVFRLLEATEAENALKQPGVAGALIVSETFYEHVVCAGSADAGSYRCIRVYAGTREANAWLRLLGAAVTGTTVRELPSPTAGPAFPALVEALLAVPCVRGAESRRLLLELFPRREIADVVPYHAEDRLHVIALARTCRRFTRGLADLLDVIKVLDPESPQVAALAALIDGQ
jgi:hypothetical protein